MPIEITNLSDLNQTLVADNLAEITQRVQERNPTIDVKRGVFHDIVLLMHAELSTKHQEELDRYRQARSLKAINEDPTLADDDIVDDVLSNYRVTRQQGSAASGEVTIIVNAPTTVTIAKDATFASNGQLFAADSVFTAKSQAAQVSAATDRLLVQLADGNYGFNITVTAVEVGSDGLIAKDALIVPSVLPSTYVTSYAAGDFTGGSDTETNEELITRLQEGLASKSSSNRINMQAMLREAFPTTTRSSIIGYGDPEMLRDQHSILPLSLGGRVDWYIRTQGQLLTTTLSREASLVSTNTDGSGVWQFSLTKDDAPGFYEVATIRLPSADNVTGGFNILSDTRGLDLTGTGLIPDIDTVEEGIYSRYQTTTIQFTDTETDHSSLSVGDKQTYNLGVSLMPNIGEIHDLLASRDYRAFGADVLIKAPIPCFVTVSLTLHNKNTSTAPDTEAIQTQLADLINAIEFNGRIYASRLHDIVHDIIDSETQVSFTDIFGRIRMPDGSDTYVRDSKVLEVPDLADQMVSYRTVQFFTSADDISVSVVTEIPTAD